MGAGHKFAPKPDFSSLDAVNQNFGSTWTRYGQSKLVSRLSDVIKRDGG